MNNAFVLEHAKALLKRRELAENGDAAARIRSIYRTALGRPPDATEITLGERFVEQHGWEQYAQVLLLTNEFVFVD
jgi:hypothetical protein